MAKNCIYLKSIKSIGKKQAEIITCRQALDNVALRQKCAVRKQQQPWVENSIQLLAVWETNGPFERVGAQHGSAWNNERKEPKQESQNMMEWNPVGLMVWWLPAKHTKS